MKILIISKRRYTNKDLLNDRYGRLFEIPEVLGTLGNDVRGVCLDYYPNKKWINGTLFETSNVKWHTFNVGLFFYRLPSYLHSLEQIVRNFSPDIIYACSDAIHAILGYNISRKYHIPVVVDLYDNFESFPVTKLPFVSTFFRKSVSNCHGITCVSTQLTDYITANYPVSGRVITLTNGTPADVFKPMDRIHCRKMFNLPENAKIVGTAGALSKSRGIEHLFAAFNILHEKDDNIHLALAGHLSSNVNLPKNSSVHYLQNLPYNKIPYFLNALDVGIICNIDTNFGRYCFPQKAFEMLGCNLPVVAAGVGVMKDMFKDYPMNLYEPGNIDELAKNIQFQLEKPEILPIKTKTWHELAEELNMFLNKIVQETSC